MLLGHPDDSLLLPPPRHTPDRPYKEHNLALEINTHLRAGGRPGATTFVGRSSVQRRPPVGHKAPCSRPCCLGTRTTASCCHRRDTHIACARNRNRPSRAIRISGFGRSGATSVGRSSVQWRPLVGHKAPCSRPCCLGTRLASPSWALACTGGMACHRCTPLAPPLCALASSPAARAGGVLLSSWLLGRKASLLAASS